MKKIIDEIIAFAIRENHFVSYEDNDKCYYIITLKKMVYSKEIKLLKKLDYMICIGDREIDILIFKK